MISSNREKHMEEHDLPEPGNEQAQDSSAASRDRDSAKQVDGSKTDNTINRETAEGKQKRDADNV